MKAATILVAAVLISPTALAEDPQRLIRGCEVLVQIYDKQGESGLLAGFTTSVSDALRAGYCRGVIDEYLRANPFGCNRDWRPMAVRIAQIGEKVSGASVEHLLEFSCGG